jgi:hypothetical protein
MSFVSVKLFLYAGAGLIGTLVAHWRKWRSEPWPEVDARLICESSPGPNTSTAASQNPANSDAKYWLEWDVAGEKFREAIPEKTRRPPPAEQSASYSTTIRIRYNPSNPSDYERLDSDKNWVTFAWITGFLLLAACVALVV